MIIGLTGLPRCGKDTFFLYLREWLDTYHKYDETYTLKRVSIGDEVRKDVYKFIKKNYKIDINNATPEEKELTRPLLKAHGVCKRKQNPEHWLGKITQEISKCLENKTVPVITDVRFVNEVKFIQAAGGMVIHLTREGIKNEPDSPELVQCFEICDMIAEIQHSHRQEEGKDICEDTFDDYYNPNKKLFYKIKQELDAFYTK